MCRDHDVANNTFKAKICSLVKYVCFLFKAKRGYKVRKKVDSGS